MFKTPRHANIYIIHCIKISNEILFKITISIYTIVLFNRYEK